MEIHQYPWIQIASVNLAPNVERCTLSGPCTHRCLDPFLPHLCKVGSGIASDRPSPPTEIQKKLHVFHHNSFATRYQQGIGTTCLTWFSSIFFPNPYQCGLIFLALVHVSSKLPHFCKCSLIFCSALVSRVTCRDINHTAFLSLLPRIAT